MIAGLANGGAIVDQAFARGVKPVRRLTVSQWADKNRVLSKKGSSEDGAWRTSRTPYLREPMDALSVESPVRRVVLMTCTQIGKTEVGLNWVGYTIDHNPQPMLVVVPTLEVRKRWVAQRLDPMLEDSPALAKHFPTKRTRQRSNAMDMKDYKAGFLVLGGANSPASLASMPIGSMLLDEIDRFPWEVGDEGDPIGLLDERQKTFPRRKMLLVSSPTMKDASRIEEEYQASDQRRYNVPCPHCDTAIILRWDNLSYNRSLTRARYICEHCGTEIEEYHKTRMLKQGVWIPENPGVAVRGYHINALYAPIGLGFSWLELAQKWVASQHDTAKLKRFVNTSLAETWEDRTRSIKAEQIQERADSFLLRQCPAGFLVITIGVDTQDDRLAVQTVGWGRNDTAAILDFVELPGSPGVSPIWHGLVSPLLSMEVGQITLDNLHAAGSGDTFKARVLSGIRASGYTREFILKHIGKQAADYYDMRPEDLPGDVWFDLVAYICTPIENQFGQVIRPSAVGIDSGGHHTHDVYRFVRSKPAPRVIALQGSNVPNKPILAGRPAPQDINIRGKTLRNGVNLWKVGTDTAKHAIFNRLMNDQNLAGDQRKVHFSSGLTLDYYQQLTSEHFDPEKNKWTKRRGRRNEGLDTLVYAMAAAYHPQVRVHALRAADWRRLESLLEPAPVDHQADQAPAPEPTKPAPAPTKPANGFKRRGL